MNVTSLAAWLLTLMIHTIPPGMGQNARGIETSAEQADRYQHIANAIATVALDPEERSVFVGKDGFGRARTATLLLSVSYFESSWRKDIDLGLTRGDGGKSCTLFQINLGAGKTPEGWTCTELLGDRTKAARAALGAIHRGTAWCRRENPKAPWPEVVLFVYASGQCDGDVIAKAIGASITVREVTAKRIERAKQWSRERPFKAFLAQHPELT